jgi:hypothetical protein
MSLSRSLPGRFAAALTIGVALTTGVACDEDGRTAPERCSDPLPLFDPATAGVPADHHPCVTPVGDAVSFVGNPPSSSTAGRSSNSPGEGGAGGQGGAGG